MKFEKEITVRVNCDYNSIHNDLIKKGFKLLETFNMHDYYMKKIDLNIKEMKTDDIIKSCILVRRLPRYGNSLLYKYKEYDKKGNIIKDGKVECKIFDVDDALKFMNAIKYETLFEIDDNIYVYTNGIFEFAIQYVNNKYLFIELEEKGHNTNKRFRNIDEMKSTLDSLNLDYDKSNYFVKKAAIILEETRK